MVHGRRTGLAAQRRIFLKTAILGEVARTNRAAEVLLPASLATVHLA